MRPRTKLIMAGTVLSLAATGGYFSGAGLDPKVQYRTIVVHSPPEVQTHVETKEVVKTLPIPDSCKLVISLAKQSFAQDKLISAAVGEINRELYQGVQHLAMNRPSEWDDVEQNITDAKRKLDEALTDKGALLTTLERNQAKCDKALQQ